MRSIAPLLALLTACQSPATSVRVTVTFGEGLGLDQLGFQVAPDGEDARQAQVPEPPAALQSGLRVVLIVPDAWDGRDTLIKVTGTAAGVVAASGQAHATPLREQVVDITVPLAASCSDECPLGDTICVGEAVSSCARSAQGCARWSAAAPCPAAKPFCSSGSCDVACHDECQDGQRRCLGVGYQICGKHDSDGCTDWGPILACSTSDLCDKGACIPSCSGKPCSCQDGATTACADVGECRGGTRTCQGGQFGACQWTVGPSAEKCDGKDNDCDGRIDNDLQPEPCDNQKGLCAGARKSCGGAAGWLACAEADYRAVAGADYEPVETKCDGKDNDCNGLVDEPAACQGSCVAVAPEVVDPTSSANTPTSIALDPAGKPHVVYGASVINIMYANRVSGAWVTQSVLSSGPSTWWKYPTIMIDPSGKQLLTVYEDYNHGFNFGTRTSPSASWSLSNLTAAMPECFMPVSTLSPGGKVYTSCMFGMKAAYGTNASGGWSQTVVESFSTYLEHPPSVVASATGVVHIAYEDFGQKQLRYADNSGGSFAPLTVDTTGSDQENLSLSLGLDKSGVSHLAYHDSTARHLKYATNAGGTWKVTVLDSSADTGRSAALALDTSDHVHVAYWDYTNGHLKYATNRSGSWVLSVADPASSVGIGTSIALDPARGTVHISYLSLGQRIKYVALCPSL